MPRYFYSFDLESKHPESYRVFAAAAIKRNMTYVFTYNGHLYRLPNATLWTLADDIRDANRMFDTVLSDAVLHAKLLITINKRIVMSVESTFISSTINKSPEKNLMRSTDLATCCEHQLHDRFFAY